MVDKRVGDLAEYVGELDKDDFFEIVDVSDTTDHASGSSRKIRNGRVGLVAQMSQPAPYGSPGYNLPGFVGVGTSTSIYGYANYITGVPFVVHRKIRITGALIIVTTGVTSSTTRLGIYNANRELAPTTLAADFGTVSSATSGRKTLTGLATDLEPGFYWTAAATSHTAVYLTYQRGVPFSLAGMIQNPAMSSLSNVYDNMYHTYIAGSAAALPATHPAVSMFAQSSTGGLDNPLWFTWVAV